MAIDGFGGDAGNVTLNWNMESRLDISQLPDGTVQVDLHGVDWQRYVLQGSTDLQTWGTNAAAITMSGGIHSYTNDPSTNASSLQIYRAMRVP